MSHITAKFDIEIKTDVFYNRLQELFLYKTSSIQACFTCMELVIEITTTHYYVNHTILFLRLHNDIRLHIVSLLKKEGQN